VDFEELSWNIQSSGVTEWSDSYMKGGTTNYVLVPKVTSGKCLWLKLPCLMAAFAASFGSEANYTTFSSSGITSEKHLY